MVRHVDAVAVLEVHEVQVVDHDQPRRARRRAVDGQRAQLRRGGPIDGGMPVEPQDLLVEALQCDAGAERDERHRESLMAFRGGARAFASVDAAMKVAGISDRDGGFCPARVRRR